MNHQLRLNRQWTDTDGTFGTIVLPNGDMFFTLEPELMNNKSNISCIPTGMYEVVRRKSPKYGWSYHVTNVPDRSFILIHSGNIKDDTEGCIILGKSRVVIGGKKAVGNGRDAVKEFAETLQYEPFTLIIEDVY